MITWLSRRSAPIDTMVVDRPVTADEHSRGVDLGASGLGPKLPKGSLGRGGAGVEAADAYKKVRGPFSGLIYPRYSIVINPLRTPESDARECWPAVTHRRLDATTPTNLRARPLAPPRAPGLAHTMCAPLRRRHMGRAPRADEIAPRVRNMTDLARIPSSSVVSRCHGPAPDLRGGRDLRAQRLSEARLILRRSVALGRGRTGPLAAGVESAPANPPGAPFAQCDACRKRGADRHCSQHRCEPDGMLVIENRVDAVQQGQAR